MLSGLAIRRKVVNDEAFHALADPTRRLLVDLLRGGQRKCVGDLVERLGVTQSAVSQHLKVLREAGLVTEEAVGRQRIYRLVPEGLEPVADWLFDLCEEYWRSKGHALGQVLETLDKE